VKLQGPPFFSLFLIPSPPRFTAIIAAFPPFFYPLDCTYYGLFFVMFWISLFWWLRFRRTHSLLLEVVFFSSPRLGCKVSLVPPNPVIVIRLPLFFFFWSSSSPPFLQIKPNLSPLCSLSCLSRRKPRTFPFPSPLLFVFMFFSY